MTKTILFLVLASHLASCFPDKALQIKNRSNPLQEKTFSITTPNKAISFCKTCIDFADQALEVLLNEILQIGVLGTCGEICSLVTQKIPSQIVGVV